uniref:Uncharacterized protein n=1 Tax=Rhizophora mucronata TaxID=61149 RepID=A0A2P2K3X3_RHIMU
MLTPCSNNFIFDRLFNIPITATSTTCLPQRFSITILTMHPQPKRVCIQLYA